MRKQVEELTAAESARRATMYRTRFPGHTFVLCRLA